MFKKTLIIGGAGFIGLSIAKYIDDFSKNKITILDNFSRGKKDKDFIYFTQKNKIKVIRGDLTNFKEFRKLEIDFDQVYMLASMVGVEYTHEVPNEIIRVNSQIILNTLEWLKNSNCKKVLFTSTSECYAGAIEEFQYQIPTPEKVPLTISDIGHPRFTYAVTKILGESAFLNYSRVFDFDATIIRYHNVYGPRMGFKHVIPQVVKRFLDGESPFQVIGGNQTRAFNFIDDAVKGTVLAMENKKSRGEVFHIGDMRHEITIFELIKQIGNNLGYKGVYQEGGVHSGSVSRRCPDTKKAEEILGYFPQTSWIKGLEKTISWYKKYYQSNLEIYE